MPPFKLDAPFKPCGDQGQAIEKLTSGILAGKQHQALLGVYLCDWQRDGEEGLILFDPREVQFEADLAAA